MAKVKPALSGGNTGAGTGSALVFQNTPTGVQISHYSTVTSITGTLIGMSVTIDDEAELTARIEGIIKNMQRYPT